ncbi:transposase, partial [Escherichia coli]|uniref:transposase n=1 Tax=Escherichia coli TaxID=562 RepID=UPI003A598991
MILWSVKKETDIRRGRHCVFLMHVHLVFVTRYRRQIFDYDATEKLRTYFSNVCADFETELVEMDGGYWRTSAATGKIARTPQNAFVVIPDCNIWSISS